MSKRRISAVVDEDIYVEFMAIAVKKFKARRGSISLAIEEAIRMWVEKNAER